MKVEEILELLPERVLEASPREDGGFDTREQHPRARLGELLRKVEDDLSDEAFMEIEAFVDRMVSSGEWGKFSWWRDYGADWPPRHTQNLCTSVAGVAYSVGSDAAGEYL
jgi:hypothetical protein